MSNPFKICFCIRFHYKEDDPRFAWRFEHFRKNVLPRIKAQTYQGFDICVWCNDWHKKLFEDLGCKTFNVKEERIRYKQHRHNPNKKFYHDFVKFEETIGLEKYDLQLGLDSDDYITPDYLEYIISVLNNGNLKDENPDMSMHLCFQPEMLILKTGQIKQFKSYSGNRGSAFMALYLPPSKPYRFIYEESHISIIKKADMNILMPKGFAFACVHEINESTGK